MYVSAVDVSDTGSYESGRKANPDAIGNVTYHSSDDSLFQGLKTECHSVCNRGAGMMGDALLTKVSCELHQSNSSLFFPLPRVFPFSCLFVARYALCVRGTMMELVNSLGSILHPSVLGKSQLRN